MSWLRDPDTGDLAKPLDVWELELLAMRAGRKHQRRLQRWTVKRDRAGKAQSIELERMTEAERGI